MPVRWRPRLRWQAPQADHCQQILLRPGIFKREEVGMSGLQGESLLRLRRSQEICPNRWLTPLINHDAPIEREASSPAVTMPKV